MSQLFKQQPQYTTFRNLTKPRVRLKVANGRECPLNPQRLVAGIERSITTYPGYNARESDILEETSSRRATLERLRKTMTIP